MKNLLFVTVFVALASLLAAEEVVKKSCFDVEQIEELRARGEILQISVLDQRDAVFGEEACGYHAWKNALVGLALTGAEGEEEVNFLVDLFEDKDFYQNSVIDFFYPDRAFPNGDKDLSILEADKAYQRLLQEEIADEKLKRLVSILKRTPYTVSFINPTESMLFGGLDESSLCNIANLYEAVTNAGPIAHAIVIGKFPHWTTFILQSDGEGEVIWYGCDSYGNQIEELLENKKILETHLQDKKNLDLQLFKGFIDAIGFDLEVKAKWLKKGEQELLLQSEMPQGIQPEALDAALLNINAIPKRVQAAFHFLKRMNLMKDPRFSHALSHIRDLADFYRTHLKEDHPLLQEMRRYSEDLATP